MFKITEKSDLNQISLTGVRALTLLELLIAEPRSLEEIKAKFVELGLMDPESPYDIIRIDLNTLRSMECEISRASTKTNKKYVLLKHPFSLNIQQEEITALKKVYKKVKEEANILMLLKYDELFKKLASHVSDNSIKEQLYGLSALKSYCTFDLNELLDDCKKHRVLNIVYRNPETKEDSKKSISAQRLVFQNDKIYLYGYDRTLSQSIILNVKRIKSIISKLSGDDGVETNVAEIKFLLKNMDQSDLKDNETVLETNDEGMKVSGIYHNEFVAVQRILSFGSNCVVIEPDEFKQKIIQKLKNMRKNYND